MFKSVENRLTHLTNTQPEGPVQAVRENDSPEIQDLADDCGFLGFGALGKVDCFTMGLVGCFAQL